MRALNTRTWAAVFVMIVGVRCARAQQQPTLPFAQSAGGIPTIRRLAVLGGENGIEVEITSSQPVSPQTRVLSGPDRIVIDFPGAVPANRLKGFSVNQGGIKAVRAGLFESSPPVTRVVLDLAAPSQYQLFPSGNTIIVKLGGAPVSTTLDARGVVPSPTPGSLSAPEVRVDLEAEGDLGVSSRQSLRFTPIVAPPDVTPVTAASQGETQARLVEAQRLRDAGDFDSAAKSNSQTTQPVPALRSLLTSVTDSGNTEDPNADPQTLAPDRRALAGAQDLSLGAPALSRSSWQPLLNLISTLDTNALTTNNAGGKTTWTSLYGGIDLRRVSPRSDLTLNCLTGGLISSDGNASNSLTQQLAFGEKLSWRRSTISFFDQLSYLPETAFGFGVPSGLSLPGGQGLSLQPVLTPNQSILTTRGPRISNSFLVEVDTLLTPRSSLTFVGSYSLLRFLHNGFLNFGNAVFQAGYNYQITRKDTIALLYRFTAFRYDNFDQSIDSHIVQVSYGRRVTGRLAFQVAAGPVVGLLRTPISTSTGTSGGSTTTTSSSTQPYWTLDTSMTYQRQRTQFGLAYDHSLSGGAGVLAGAVNDQVSGSINSQLSRSLNGGFVLGYARNQGLNVTAPTPSNQSYNYWFSGVNFGHRWGHSTNLFLSYQVQFQDSNTGFCVGTTCGKSFLRHTVSLGIDWRSRPVPIE